MAPNSGPTALAPIGRSLFAPPSSQEVAFWEACSTTLHKPARVRGPATWRLRLHGEALTVGSAKGVHFGPARATRGLCTPVLGRASC
jgi:hypothetical protein